MEAEPTKLSQEGKNREAQNAIEALPTPHGEEQILSTQEAMLAKGVLNN